MSQRTGFKLTSADQYTSVKDPGDSLYYGRNHRRRFPGRTVASIEITQSSGVTIGVTSGVGTTVSMVLISGGTEGVPGFVRMKTVFDNGEISYLNMNFIIKQL